MTTEIHEIEYSRGPHDHGNHLTVRCSCGTSTMGTGEAVSAWAARHLEEAYERKRYGDNELLNKGHGFNIYENRILREK